MLISHMYLFIRCIIVDCGERTELQPAVSSVQCPRRNGYFSHEDPEVCDRFYNCVEGVANPVTCPSGLIYDDYQGTCTWPDSAQRKGCEKENRKKGKDGGDGGNPCSISPHCSLCNLCMFLYV